MQKLTHNDVKQNIQNLQQFMQAEKISHFYISSFDTYLNEYVPLSNCRRYFVTGFTGSVAEVLVLPKGKVKLYVDGRYHEQADNQVDSALVEVVKVKNTSNMQSMLEELQLSNVESLALEGDRTPLSFYQRLDKPFTLKAYNNGELDSVIAMPSVSEPPKIDYVDKSITGEETEQKLKRVIANPDEALFITALDSLAWLANGRGYHLPCMSSFMGKALATPDKLFVFIDDGVEYDQEFAKHAVEFIEVNAGNFRNVLEKTMTKAKVKKIAFDSSTLNSADYLILKDLLGEENLRHQDKGIVPFHALKNETEISQMEQSFSKAAKAIFDTINWVKDQNSGTASEMDLYKKTSEMYQVQGAKSQSFNTISGAGANGSIIHYSEPKEDVKIQDTDMCLLDSGGYFESGYATDCTRTFMGGRNIEPDKELKKMYTLTLKGFLQAQSAVFPEGTPGIVIDGLARNPMMHYGFNYAHGTGHGVGIHVHEGGTGISSKLDNKLKVGHVVSVEPGVYFPGVGGVRIENVCLVEKHPEFDGFCRFRPLIYLGLEVPLIDFEMLTSEEKKYFDDYQQECEKRGLIFN